MAKNKTGSTNPKNTSSDTHQQAACRADGGYSVEKSKPNQSQPCPEPGVGRVGKKRKLLSAPFALYGGKAYYASQLLPWFPQHELYVEPFGGAGHVLLAKPPSTVEVYNDLDGRLTNFYRVLRDPDLFERLRLAIELTPHSRQEFNDILGLSPSNDPVEQARRLFSVMRQARGGLGISKITPSSWAVSTRPRRKMPEQVSKLLTAIDGLGDVHERLREVTIECLPALEIIEKYDSPNALFYFDPPYVPETRCGGRAAMYAHEMTVADHEQLIAAILKMHGKAMISGYASELYDRALRGWQRVEIPARAHMNNSGAKRVEVIWMNYEPPAEGVAFACR